MKLNDFLASDIINKLNYNDINIEKYKNLISEKFDEQSTVIKFIDFIKSSCIDNQDNQEDINEVLDTERLIKYNFRFILSNIRP